MIPPHSEVSIALTTGHQQARGYRDNQIGPLPSEASNVPGITLGLAIGRDEEENGRALALQLHNRGARFRCSLEDVDMKNECLMT